MNYVSYFYTKQLHTLKRNVSNFQSQRQFVILFSLCLLHSNFNGLIVKLSSFLGSFALSFPFIIFQCFGNKSNQSGSENQNQSRDFTSPIIILLSPHDLIGLVSKHEILQTAILVYFIYREGLPSMRTFKASRYLIQLLYKLCRS